jgi:subtilisin-like proprotein convertase family protein
MNCCKVVIAFLIALLLLNNLETEARPSRPAALDSTDRVTYVYDGPPVSFGEQNSFVELNAAEFFNINDVDVLVSIEHSYVSDVVLRLEDPRGVSVLLVESVGFDEDNFTNTEFNDDAAASIVQGTAPYTGSFQPIEPLSALNGGSGAGTWTLYLEDIFPWADDGTLMQFEMTLGGRIGGVIQGRITSLATQQPLSGVRLEYIDTPFATTTDNDGYYSLLSTEGVYDLFVSYPYWCSDGVDSIVLTLHDTLDYDFQLGKPEFAISVSSVNIVARADTTTDESFVMMNEGNCPLDWTLEIQDAWLTSNMTSGEIEPGSNLEITLTVHPEGIGPGDFVTRMTIDGNAEHMPMVIPVLLYTVNADEQNTFPQEFALLGSYPNPFNSSTSIRYALPKTSDVSLRLYSSEGRLVDEMNERGVTAGIHELRLDLRNAASGIYFAQLSAGSFSGVQRIVLIK